MSTQVFQPGEHNTREAELQTARQDEAQPFDAAGRVHKLAMDAASSAARRHSAQHFCEDHPRVCGHAGAASRRHRRHHTDAVKSTVLGPYACGAALSGAAATAYLFWTSYFWACACQPRIVCLVTWVT